MGEGKSVLIQPRILTEFKAVAFQFTEDVLYEKYAFPKSLLSRLSLVPLRPDLSPSLLGGTVKQQLIFSGQQLASCRLVGSLPVSFHGVKTRNTSSARGPI